MNSIRIAEMKSYILTSFKKVDLARFSDPEVEIIYDVIRNRANHIDVSQYQLFRSTRNSSFVDPRMKCISVSLSYDDIELFEFAFIHELAHVHQINSGKLKVVRDAVHFGDVKVSTQTIDHYHKNQFVNYIRLPWEAEANNFAFGLVSFDVRRKPDTTYSKIWDYYNTHNIKNNIV